MFYDLNVLMSGDIPFHIVKENCLLSIVHVCNVSLFLDVTYVIENNRVDVLNDTDVKSISRDVFFFSKHIKVGFSLNVKTVVPGFSELL